MNNEIVSILIVQLPKTYKAYLSYADPKDDQTLTNKDHDYLYDQVERIVCDRLGINIWAPSPF